MEFSWDSDKAASNLRRHGVSFGEAATVFGDSLSITAPDPDHSRGENRYIIVGTSDRNRTLLVAHTERDLLVRIISARTLTRKERKQYEEGSA